jgi:hypothetical protein
MTVLLNSCLVIQENLFNVIVSCASSAYLWQHIQSLLDVVSVLVWR